MNNIFQKLQQGGYRLTRPRQQILKTLTEFPQSVEEIIITLKKKNIVIDRVTIYRTLDCLVNLGVVGRTQFNDKIFRYELVEAGHHHHHLVCNKCGLVEDIALSETRLLHKVSKQTNFLVKSHSLEFFGLCGQCQ